MVERWLHVRVRSNWLGAAPSIAWHSKIKMIRLYNTLPTCEIDAHVLSNPMLCQNNMEVKASRQQGVKTPISNPYSCTRYQTYSIVGETNDALSEMSSVRVFQTDKKTPTLNLVDVLDLSGQPRKSGDFTFHDVEDLDKYLMMNPMIGGIRFM